MSVEIKSISYDIIGGPNRGDLVNAFMYAYQVDIPIEFLIVEGYSQPKDHPGSAAYLLQTKNVKVTSIQHESGTGYNFNIAGFMDAKTGQDWHPYRFEAYYNAKTRNGNIKLIK